MIQIAFDRYLLPSTISRQSFVIVDNVNAPLAGQPLKTVYDPVARTVTIIGPDGPGKAWLAPDQSYKLALLVASDPNSDLGGFRAIDRAALDRGQKREFVFRAGPPTGQLSYEPAVDFCADVMPILYNKCSGSLCHGNAETAATSLVLQSADGIRATAIGRVAQGANTSARAYSPDVPGPIFGVNMAIIQPGDPGSSWLMYKLELGRAPVVDAGAAPPVACALPPGAPSIPAPLTGAFNPLAPSIPIADDLERTILSDYVIGREMPYPTPSVDYFSQPLTFQERERIRIWIARGAGVRNCGACANPASAPADAGARSPVDASDQ